MFRTRFLCLALLYSATVIYGQALDSLVHRSIQFSHVEQALSLPQIDGHLDDACWQNAVQLADFVLTAGKPGKVAEIKTECRLIYDDTHLYAAFRCLEPKITQLKAKSKMWDDPDIEYDDRVSLFIDMQHDHRSFWELSVNPAGVQFDQSGYNRLHGSKTCDMNPAANCRWRAKTQIENNAWTVEIEIDVTSLGLSLITPGLTWGFNAARVRLPDVEKGDELFQRVPTGDAEYSAWSLTRDFIRETVANFYAPLEFGDLVFGDPGFRVREISLRSALFEFGPLGNPTRYGFNPLHIKIDHVQEPSQPVLLKRSVLSAHYPVWQATCAETLTAAAEWHSDYFIPEDLENLIVVEILAAKNKQILYRTSYYEWALPFIEFDLETLYTRHPGQTQPVRFRVLTDSASRHAASLTLAFINPVDQQTIAAQTFTDLSRAEQWQPVFDTALLRSLPGGDYAIDCRLDKNGQELVRFVQNLTKVDNAVPLRFTAEETEYSFGGIQDQAIRVRYPFAAEFVFWRSASYIPFWDVEQAAMSNEFIECWGAGNQGCSEPMQDRECRYSTVQLIEASPARAVVHWRYALSDPHYRIYRNEWVDEYYTLYPDGAGIRQVNLWPNSSTRHEMFEVLLAKPPGVQTLQLFDEEFATLANLKGERFSNKYLYQNAAAFKNFLSNSDDFIIEILCKDRLHPFTVFSFNPELLPGVSRDHVTACSRIIDTADRRGHWPASRFQIDGYNSVGLDRPHHGNIGNIQAEIDIKKQPQTWTFLIGVHDPQRPTVQQQASSWLHPGRIICSGANFSFAGYDASQRVYRIRQINPSERCTFKMQNEQPVYHPVFLISTQQPCVTVHLNGKRLADTEWQSGKSAKSEQVIYLGKSIRSTDRIDIYFK